MFTQSPQQIKEVEARLDQNQGNLEFMDKVTLQVRLEKLEREIAYWEIRLHDRLERYGSPETSGYTQAAQEWLEYYDAQAWQVEQELKRRSKVCLSYNSLAKSNANP